MAPFSRSLIKAPLFKGYRLDLVRWFTPGVPLYIMSGTTYPKQEASTVQRSASGRHSLGLKYERDAEIKDKDVFWLPNLGTSNDTGLELLEGE